MKNIFCLFLVLGIFSNSNAEIIRNERGVPVENASLGYFRPLIKSMNEVYYHPQARLSEGELLSCLINPSNLVRQVDGIFLGTDKNVANYVSHSLILIRDGSGPSSLNQRWSYFIAQGSTHLNSAYGLVSGNDLRTTLMNPVITEAPSETLLNMSLEVDPEELLARSPLLLEKMRLLLKQGFIKSSAATSLPLDFSSESDRCHQEKNGVLVAWRLQKENRDSVVLVFLRPLGPNIQVTLLNPFLVFSKLREKTILFYVNSLGKN